MQQVYQLNEQEKKKLQETYLKMKLYFEEKKYRSTFLQIVPNDYYERSLQNRKQLLKAPSDDYLCKSLILQNKSFKEYECSNEVYYPEFMCVIIQYTTTLNSSNLEKEIKSLQNKNCPDQIIAKKGFNFQLAGEDLQPLLHDYEHNGVAPFNLKKKMTFFLSEKIANLDPQFFWLGGGHPDIKLRISVAEFIKKCENPIFVADIADYDIKDIDNIKKND